MVDLFGIVQSLKMWRYHPMRNYRFVVSPSAQFLCSCALRSLRVAAFSVNARIQFCMHEHNIQSTAENSCTQIYWHANVFISYIQFALLEYQARSNLRSSISRWNALERDGARRAMNFIKICSHWRRWADGDDQNDEIANLSCCVNHIKIQNDTPANWHRPSAAIDFQPKMERKMSWCLYMFTVKVTTPNKPSKAHENTTKSHIS